MVKTVRETNKPKHMWLLALGILLLIAGAGYKTYIWYAIRADKQRFTEASLLVDKIYADIVTELGKPLDSKRTNSCSRPYREFTGYGDPTCNINRDLIYGEDSIATANSKMKSTQVVINRYKIFIPTKELASEISSGPTGNVIVYDAQDEYRYNNLICSIKYVFDSPSESFLKIRGTTKKPLYITLGCYGKAKSQIYPSIQ